MTTFAAQELHSDGTFRTASYRFTGSTGEGYFVERNGSPHLELPPGYAMRKVRCCGICSTDQARPHLPFPLPQIIGHEVLVEEGNRLAAVEINASHAAVGAAAAAECPACTRGLPTHCPDRLVLGIDRLPGGFGPRILVPEANIVPVPDGLPPDTAVLVEPFAAALHAAESVDLEGANSVAVLGAGRLGLLITAALEAVRRERGIDFTLTAIERDRARAAIALRLGADEAVSGEAASGGAASGGTGSTDRFDTVIEATGHPDGLGLALALAKREVHVKSTTGRKTLGLRHLTEMVVDEVTLVSGTGRELEGLASRGLSPVPVDDVDGSTGADTVLATSLEEIDGALRPRPDREVGLVRPRGTIVVAGNAPAEGLLAPLLTKGLRVTTSRCGDLRRAFPALERLRADGIDPGSLLVTRHLPAADMNAALAAARQPGAIKVVVDHAPLSKSSP